MEELLDNVYGGMSDEELVDRAASDKRACEALILRYTKLIFIKAAMFSASEADRDDLCQEGLMALLKAISSYDAGRNARFSTFAEVCIVNKMRSVRARAERGGVCENIDDVSEEVLSEGETPESIYMNKEFFSELRRAVESELSGTERQVFDSVIRGASYRETASMLGITEKSVDNAMQRARRKIRAYLK
ncbi:MAG: sigma-70 family RNA polymerase sigma factor [Ruminococcus sp.]|nr:sigma-70 family RNA polymerase sigma factor [Ruminococcus sp.]